MGNPRDYGGKRVNPPYIAVGLLTKVISLKLFLDIVPSSSADITPAMRGQSKRLSRSYRGQKGGNVIVYALISFHSRDLLCAFSRLFVECSFGCSLFGCISARYNSVFISLPLFVKGLKTMT